MRKIIVIIILFYFNSSIAQNQSYYFFEDSIFPIMQTQYSLAKKKYLNSRKTHQFDPQYTLAFLNESIIQNDLRFFRKEISTLIRDYGFYFAPANSSNLFDYSPLQNIFDNKELSNWLANRSKRLYPKWLATHPNSVAFQLKIVQLKSKDQQIRGISFEIIPCIENLTEDTSIVNSFIRQYSKMINTVDLDNIITLQSICIVNNNSLPTNFDSGSMISKSISLIISHNLKRKENLNYTWENFYPFIENAYLSGKISNHLLYEYDYYLNKHFGMQYYGFLEENVPVLKPESFEYRKKKFCQ